MRVRVGVARTHGHALIFVAAAAALMCALAPHRPPCSCVCSGTKQKTADDFPLPRAVPPHQPVRLFLSGPCKHNIMFVAVKSVVNARPWTKEVLDVVYTRYTSHRSYRTGRGTSCCRVLWRRARRLNNIAIIVSPAYDFGLVLYFVIIIIRFLLPRPSASSRPADIYICSKSSLVVFIIIYIIIIVVYIVRILFSGIYTL